MSPTPTPTLSSSNYNQATGVLTLTGKNLTISATGYQIANFSLQGNGGGSYQLTSGSAILGTPTRSSVTIQLSVDDQSAINTLLNQNGTAASDGTVYNLTATAGWDSGAAAISTEAVTASGVVTDVLLQTLSKGVSAPQNIAIDNSGNIWVSNQGTNTVEEFSASGVLLQTISNGVSRSDGLAVDSKGDVFVANAGNNTVEEFSASGNLLHTLSNGVSEPSRIVVDGTGNVWVSNFANNTVETFSASGALLQTFYGLSEPEGLAIDNKGNVWVSNIGNYTVQEFSSSGMPLQTLSNGINYPWDLAVDSKGDVFVANAGNNTVKEFSASGQLLLTLSNGISRPYQLAVDNKGDVFVANYGNNTVEEFSASGALLQTLTNEVSKPYGLAVDSKGNVYVGNDSNNSVEVFGAPSAATVTNATYAENTGKLVLTGTALDTTAGSYTVSHFTLKGDGGISYQLTGGSAISGTPTSTSVTILLSAADQLALDGLLNQNGTSANDGIHYSLFASTGWDNNALAVANAAVTASGVMAPTLSAVAYNGATGQFSFTGDHLVNQGGNVGINLADFSLSIGAAGTFAFNSSDSVSGLTGRGFTVSLSAADQASVNALLNGVHSGKLSALAGWDSDSGAAISAQTVKLPPQLGGVSYNQATGQLTLTGTNLTTTASGYQVGDFSIKGNGGGSYHLTGGSTVLGTPTSTAVTIQLSVADQSAINALLNQNGTSASDSTAYNLTAKAGWDTEAAAISSEAVTATGVVTDVLLQTLSKGVSYPGNLAIDNGGNIWVSNDGNSAVEEFSANGTLLQTLLSGVSNPKGLAIDNKGNVWVANSGNNTVQEFSASGTLLHTLSNGVSYPDNLAIDNSGNVWVSNDGNSAVEEFSANGTLLQTLLSGVSNPKGLAIDNRGNVWVANTGNNTVQEFSSSGVLLQTLSSGISDPWDLAVDSRGNVFVANAGNNTVEEFSTIGVLSPTLSKDVLLNTLSNGISRPYQLAVDSKGDVWVANYGNNTVEEFSASGVLLQTISNGVSVPDGLAVDSKGNVYVGNVGNNTVQEFGAPSAAAVTSASYDENTGKLVLTGNALDTTAGNYTVSDFTLKGDGGVSYQLTGGSVISGTPTSTRVTLQLSAADQLALDGLLNQNGTSANDGSHYVLSTSFNWDQNALAVANAVVTASGVKPPTLSAVAYNGATGQFSFTGDHLVNQGGNVGINLADFSLSIGAAGTFAFNSSDSVSGLTGSGFTVSLSTADQASVNALLNGVHSGKLSALAGWDSDSGAAISAQTVKLPPQLGGVSYNAATGQLTLSGTNLTTTSGYQVGDFKLNGGGGISYQLTGGSVISGTPTSTRVTLQLSAADQLALHGVFNQNGSAARDGTAYNLTATAGWDTGAAAISTEAVTASGVVTYSLLQTLGDGFNISTPNYIAVDNSGNIWVANTGTFAQSVEEFSANGTLLQTLTNNIYNPDAIAFDGAGNVWVTNDGNNTVEEFSTSGTLLQTLSNGISEPTGLALDSNGNVWVANFGNNTVEEFSANGSLLQTLSNGMNNPYDVVVDNNSGNVWVSNYGNNSVEEFSTSGTLLQTLSNGGGSTPNLLALDSSGNVWVTNDGNNTVEEFSTSGTLLQTLSNGISEPTGLALDSNGNVWVANFGNNTVEEFSASGVLLQTLTNGIDWPISLAVDSNGKVYVGNELTPNRVNGYVEVFGVAHGAEAHSSAVELLAVTPHAIV